MSKGKTPSKKKTKSSKGGSVYEKDHFNHGRLHHLIVQAGFLHERQISISWF